MLGKNLSISGYFAADRKRDDLHNTRYRQFASLMCETGGPMRHNPEKRQAETWHLPCAGGEILRLASLAQDDSAVDGQLMTPSVMALAGDAPCHLPQRGRHFCSLPEGGYVGTFSAARGPHPAAARPPFPCAGKAMTPHPSCGGRDTPYDTFSSRRRLLAPSLRELSSIARLRESSPFHK